MDKNNKDSYFINGIKFSLGIIFTFGILFSVFAVGFHLAEEILPGTFNGNFSFNDKIEINNTLIVDNIDFSPTKTQTIDFDNSMTAAEIQAIIESVPRFIPSGQTITFQFADGTYNLNQQLSFFGFYGGGNIFIFGNTAEADATTLHTTQQVFLDFSSVDSSGIYVGKTMCGVYIYNLKIKVNTNINWRSAIQIAYTPIQATIRNSYLLGTDTTYGIGIYNTYGTIADMRYNYVSNLARGVECSGESTCFSFNTDDTGTLPAYGLYVQSAGTLGKYGIQPAGSTANENVGSGGEIR